MPSFNTCCAESCTQRKQLGCTIGWEVVLSEDLTSSDVKGLVVLDDSGTILTSLGVGSDPRIRNVLTGREWITEARRKRIVPILTRDIKVVAFVKEITGGLLFVLSDI